MLVAVAAKRGSYHHGELRRALIDATLRLAAERGAAGVTLREAARLAGVSQTAPYRHFADKTAMLAAASEEGFVMLAEALQAAARPHPRDPRARIVALGAAYVEFAVGHTPHFRLMFGQGSPPKAVARALQARARDAFQLLFIAVGECVQRRLVARGDVRAMTFHIWALAHGIATLIVERQTVFLEIGVDAAVAITQSALAAQLRGLERSS